ncbi:hypothetical protein [Aliikangiella sp. IMCC44632]
MSNKYKFIILFVVVSIFAITEMYIDSQKSLNFEADGIVTEARWNTANHDMPFFVMNNRGQSY